MNSIQRNGLRESSVIMQPGVIACRGLGHCISCKKLLSSLPQTGGIYFLTRLLPRRAASMSAEGAMGRSSSKALGELR